MVRSGASTNADINIYTLSGVGLQVGTACSRKKQQEAESTSYREMLITIPFERLQPLEEVFEPSVGRELSLT
jgi:hypothetical protein